MQHQKQDIKSNTNSGYKKHRGPKGIPLLGSMFKARRDPLQFAMDLSRNYGDLSYFRIGLYSGYFLNHPDYFKHVLQTNQRNYSKDNYNYKKLKIVLGEGLITSNGNLWLKERRMIQPVFQHSHTGQFAAITGKATREMLHRWKTIKKRDFTLDIASEMMQLTLRIITEALFSIDMSNHAKTVSKAFTVLNQDISHRFQTFFSAPLWINTASNRQFKKARSELNQVVSSIISNRRKSSTRYDDLLDMLLAVRDDQSGQQMNDQQIRDEIMTLLLAGHETTATLLSWTLYLLSQHKEVKDKLSAELKQQLKGKYPDMKDISRLKYCTQVIQESLRLYPPVWIISRKAIKEDIIGGYRIPAGATVVLCSYTLHRHQDYWHQPHLFNPQRFSSSENENPAAYFPFSIGPRSCIGAHFAMTEACLILSMLLQHFDFKLQSGFKVEPEPLVTLRPRHGLKMVLKSVLK